MSHASKDTKGLTPWVRRITCEPFVHFTLLGALVFAGHCVLAPTLDVPTIEVSTPKQRELAKLFEQRQERAPNDVERQQLVRRYVEDEALFREGVRLSLIHTDPMLRAQMIARVRSMLQAELDQTPPTEVELKHHYEAHRSDYARSGSEPSFETNRARLSADYRKERTSRAFQAELSRLTSQWHVQLAERP